jgi:acetylornithine/succinyldiaminopimelate/putrescine aminotransferase
MGRETFLQKLGQTSPYPFLIDVDRAEGIYIYDKSGKPYMDMISGVSVNNIGHRHPRVIQALREQLDRHLHVMVYGEFIQDSVNLMADRLTALLPKTLNCVYPVNSGTEANEAAIKLAKRVTGRTEIVSFRGSYHGSTFGSLSVSGNEVKKLAFRPLMPDVRFLHFNVKEELIHITEKTAGVIIETIQGDAGVRIPDKSYLEALRQRCSEVGALLIFDEIQAGMGRTGKVFAFEHFGVVPDVLTLGKALGGGMNIGALVASHDHLRTFTYNPMLGHITTFGGHPMPCAAAAATLQVMSELDLNDVERLGLRLEHWLRKSEEVIEIRRKGMFFAIDMVSAERVAKVVQRCLSFGLITFWFLSHPNSFRLAPPLTITEQEIDKAGALILRAIQETSGLA